MVILMNNRGDQYVKNEADRFPFVGASPVYLGKKCRASEFLACKKQASLKVSFSFLRNDGFPFAKNEACRFI
jgi:hypothetical protein